jgi:hypothetical protein
MIQTAEEFLLRQGCVRTDKTFFDEVEAIDLIEFAKLHVENFVKSDLTLKEYLELHAK